MTEPALSLDDSIPTPLEEFHEAVAALLEVHLPSVDYTDARVRRLFFDAAMAAEAFYPLEPYLVQVEEKRRRGLEKLAAGLPAHRAVVARLHERDRAARALDREGI